MKKLLIFTLVVILFLVVYIRKKYVYFFPHENYPNNSKYCTIDDFYFVNDMDFIKNLSSSNKEIPKIIWTFWHDEKKIPNLVKYCIETWTESNPDYKIYLLTKNNYHNFINIPKYITEHPNMNDYYARFSDMIRIHLLYEYGGVWMDASIICKESLDDWFFSDIQSYEKNLFGYYIQQNTTDNRFPVIENWFIASTPKNIFILLWKNEFMELTSFSSVDEYLNNRKNLGVNFQKIPSPSYLAMYVSAQKILQIDKYPTDKMYLKKAEDGPYRYISKNNWNSEKSLKMACNRKEYTKFMKLTNRERNFLQKYVDDYNSELSKYKCNWFENFVIL